MLDVFLYVVTILLQVVMTWYFFITISEAIVNEKYSMSKKAIIFAAIIPVVIITFYLKKFFPINTLIAVFAYIFYGIYILKIKLSGAIITSISLPILTAILEVICVYIFMIIFNITSQQILESKVYYAALIITHSFLIILFAYLLKMLIYKKTAIKNFFTDISTKEIKSFLIIMMFCVLPQIFMFAFNKYDYSLSFLIINSIQMIVISIFTVIFVRRFSENEKIQRELTLSELHNKTMVNMVDGIRILKHDYNNIMQALNGYVSTKQYDKLQEHLSKVISECNDINTLSVITPDIFNEPAVYGIVGAKYFIAMDKNIKFDFDITSNISSINFPMPDLSRILGILLDNAIEATSKVNNKYIKLEMRYDLRKAADIIKITNTYDKSINMNLEDIYKKGFSTKAVKSGLGLWEVQKLINRSGNSQIYPAIENGKFIQTIIIEKA
jgi:two-component system sensor histidine kinase AgrC